MNKNIIPILIAGSSGLAIGSVTTLLILRRRFEMKLEREIDDVKTHFLGRLLEMAPTVVPDYSEEENDSNQEPLFEENTYDIAVDVYGQIQKDLSRNIDADVFLGESDDEPTPYVVSAEEFSEEKTHYDKITLTYFSEDNTLIDDREEIIPNIDELIGPEAVMNFGNQSDDPNVVYIRNNKRNADFEVVLDERSYTEVVLGFVSEKEKPRKMRDLDETL